MYKEVEIKAKLTDPAKTLKLLANFGIEFGPPIHQHDKIFSPRDLEDFGAFHQGISFLRVRRQDDDAFFTLKKSELNELESTEIETKVSDPEATENIIREVGYVFSTEVRKTRRKAKHNDTELCYDEVEDLGTFIELERIMEMGSDVEKAQGELFEFLKQFGVDEADRVTKGYDTLMLTLADSKQ
ncbi:hypothetical protein A3A71_03900 [Candidatus Berkelbacteria bacterium RIFCSPLOWO2_01_FULL_50_28]|uniref:CYTH domain-containing protein n=1 Tax=Candidatus Berkelbacteria bacterium RIFCSPLOWO2_01_FULL_50_28 TaxID=1797471 RepID=A0A1F5EAI2_9BACT|nr:MAG: hypothetical protein A3F39_01265 [Candidatus Berkelbacteria bacterium RIFCSPHIGHO2_12_FULL_50_11]OGD64286.1 MAG: hypothetical protein A3A71_03900 [Candidatus Berkelbacteria bacterium RIFCSPLOWO2_01_FULL_50_28]